MLALSALKAAAAPYKVYAYAIGAVLLIGLVTVAVHRYNERLREQGRAETRPQLVKVQGEYDTYLAKIRQEAQARQQENARKDAEVRATNEGALHEYQATLVSIAADRDVLSRLYHNKARTSCIAMPKTADKPATANATAQPGSLQEADQLLGEFNSACRADAAQLEALIAEIKPQL